MCWSKGANKDEGEGHSYGKLDGALGLTEASFEEKADLVAMLGIKVCPSEDLKSRSIACRLNLQKVTGEREQGDLAKVVFGGLGWVRTTNTLRNGA